MDSTYDDHIDQTDIAIPSQFEDELDALFNDDVWNATNNGFNDIFMEPDSQGPSSDINMIIQALNDDPLDPSVAEVIANLSNTTVLNGGPNEATPLEPGALPHSSLPELEMEFIRQPEFDIPTIYTTGAQDMMFSAPENLIPV